MKHFFFLAFLALFANGFSDVSESSWSMNKRSALFSFTAEFECKGGDVLQGTGVRTYAGCPRYYYDLFDTQNQFEARGITRFFSLGALAAWAMDIDLYDIHGNYFGMIQGKVFTRARAKFAFYDARGVEVADAFLNTETTEFIITSPLNESVILAQLKGRDFGDIASWELITHRPLPIDQRLLKIFAIFIADYHREFIVPPVEIHFNNYFIQNN